MADRRIHIDVAPGQTRGVITMDGRPERLVIERDGAAWPLLGTRYRARAVKIDKGLGLASLDLGGGLTGALRLKPDRAPPTEGQALEVEVSIEPQGEKAAVVRALGPASGAPALLQDAPTLTERLAALAPEAPVSTGAGARAIADEAEDEVLAVEHRLPAGASLSIEITRALTAVDIDLGQGGGRDPKRAARQANFDAIAHLARLLRLKAMGGLVVIDLVGRGHDGTALARAVQTAFGPDQPGVVLGPITKFGTLELALPRRRRPLRELLCDAEGRRSVETLALQMVRQMHSQAQADPGARLTVRCAPGVVEAAALHTPALAGIIGQRFEVVPDLALPRETWDIAIR
jgi:hypothetical protein